MWGFGLGWGHGWRHRARETRPTIILDLAPEFGKVVQGDSMKAMVSVRPSSSHRANVILTTRAPTGGGLPAGLSVNFDPPSGVPPFSSTMTISTSPEIQPGTYSFLVVGVCEDVEQVKACTLLVFQGAGIKKEIAPTPEKMLQGAVALAMISILAGVDVPIYPKASLKNESRKGDWRTNIYKTADSVEDVLNFYKAEMPKRGWELASETSGVPAGLKYAKQNIEALITISSLELTTISLMVGPKTD